MCVQVQWNAPFPTAEVLTMQMRKKRTGVSNSVNDGSDLFECVSKPYRCESERLQGPETEAAKRNSGIINFIIYTCAFPTGPC